MLDNDATGEQCIHELLDTDLRRLLFPPPLQMRLSRIYVPNSQSYQFLARELLIRLPADTWQCGVSAWCLWALFSLISVGQFLLELFHQVGLCQSDPLKLIEYIPPMGIVGIFSVQSVPSRFHLWSCLGC